MTAFEAFVQQLHFYEFYAGLGLRPWRFLTDKLGHNTHLELVSDPGYSEPQRVVVPSGNPSNRELECLDLFAQRPAKRHALCQLSRLRWLVA